MNLSAFRKAPVAALIFVVAACIALPAFAADRKVQRRVAPMYPEIAKRMHIEGTVRVEVNVTPDGSVIQAKAISGNRMLVPAAEDALKRWKFAPEAAPTTENVAVDFEVSD